MILYVDTSSLLKLYVEEHGSEVVRALIASAKLVGSSLVAYAEVRSGLARAQLGGRLAAGQSAAVIATFESNWTQFEAITVSQALVRDAGDLAARHILRGFDAIHLSSALVLQAQSGESLTFSAWDDRLLAAARAEGLTVAPSA